MTRRKPDGPLPACVSAVAQRRMALWKMPLGQPKISEAELAVIREWIQQGLLENANSQSKGPVVQSLDFKPSNLNKPTGAPAMPQTLAPLSIPEPARPRPGGRAGGEPLGAAAGGGAGHERIYLYDLTRARPW